jgi:hypothetical protein
MLTPIMIMLGLIALFLWGILCVLSNELSRIANELEKIAKK